MVRKIPNDPQTCRARHGRWPHGGLGRTGRSIPFPVRKNGPVSEACGSRQGVRSCGRMQFRSVERPVRGNFGIASSNESKLPWIRKCRFILDNGMPAGANPFSRPTRLNGVLGNGNASAGTAVRIAGWPLRRMALSVRSCQCVSINASAPERRGHATHRTRSTTKGDRP